MQNQEQFIRAINKISHIYDELLLSAVCIAKQFIVSANFLMEKT